MFSRSLDVCRRAASAVSVRRRPPVRSPVRPPIHPQSPLRATASYQSQRLPVLNDVHAAGIIQICNRSRRSRRPYVCQPRCPLRFWFRLLENPFVYVGSYTGAATPVCHSSKSMRAFRKEATVNWEEQREWGVWTVSTVDRQQPQCTSAYRAYGSTFSGAS